MVVVLRSSPLLGIPIVVPTGDETQWTYPPFSAEIVDDILYGRGAADMKVHWQQ